MKDMIRAVVYGFLLGLVVITAYIFGSSMNAPKNPHPLKVFRLVLVDGSHQDLLGDRLEFVGRCTVIITEEKPVVYLCFDHMLLPLGPAPQPKVPEEIKPTPKDSSQEART